MKEKIRPIYSELQGYLSQAPPIGENGNSMTQDLTLRGQFNVTIEELNHLTGKNFDKFKIVGIENGRTIQQFMRISEYRQKLGGLISRLHGEFYNDEQPPFSGMPNTVITQTQNQTQSLNMVLEIHERIVSEIHKYNEGSKERSFLEKIKNSLTSIKSFTDILASILRIGSEFGLDPHSILKLLGL